MFHETIFYTLFRAISQCKCIIALTPVIINLHQAANLPQTWLTLQGGRVTKMVLFKNYSAKANHSDYVLCFMVIITRRNNTSQIFGAERPVVNHFGEQSVSATTVICQRTCTGLSVCGDVCRGRLMYLHCTPNGIPIVCLISRSALWSVFVD